MRLLLWNGNLQQRDLLEIVGVLFVIFREFRIGHVCLPSQALVHGASQYLQVGELQNFVEMWVFIETEFASFASEEELLGVEAGKFGRSVRRLVGSNHAGELFKLRAGDDRAAVWVQSDA